MLSLEIILKDLNVRAYKTIESLEQLQSNIEIVKTSKEETLYALNLDFFSLQKRRTAWQH